MHILRKSGAKNIINILCSGLFEIWIFSVQRMYMYSDFTVIEEGIFFMETSNYSLECHTDLANKFHTSVSHICWRVWSPNVTYDWFAVSESWRVPHVGEETLTLSGTLDFTHFGEFMISPIHFITYINLSVLRSRLRINDSGLFAWISLTALSRTYFVALNWSENSFGPPKKTSR